METLEVVGVSNESWKNSVLLLTVIAEKIPLAQRENIMHGETQNLDVLTPKVRNIQGMVVGELQCALNGKMIFLNSLRIWDRARQNSCLRELTMMVHMSLIIVSGLLVANKCATLDKPDGLPLAMKLFVLQIGRVEAAYIEVIFAGVSLLDGLLKMQCLIIPRDREAKHTPPVEETGR